MSLPAAKTPPDTIPVVIITGETLPPHLLDQVRAVSPRLAVEHRVAASLDEVDGELLHRVEVLYTDRLLPRPDQAPALRWVQSHSAGVEKYRDHPLLQRVTYTNSSGIHAPVIGEYVLMMMLALSHRLSLMLDYQRRAEWSHDLWPGFNAQELRGATVGIVGYGSIGREVGRLARAFGMRVLALKRDAGRASDPGWRLPGVGDPGLDNVARLFAPDELHAMLRECHYVVLAAPLTPETRHMIGPAEFAVMQPGVVLVNVARGGLVDEAALVAALQSGQVGGAALDVFDQEPLPPESPLWRLPNVHLSPHIADANSHYIERAMELFAENLRRYLAGEPLFNVVDVSRGY